MKVEILKENVRTGLQAVERVIGKNLSLPVLDSVYLEAQDGFLMMAATDLETTVKWWVFTKIVKKGSAAIPAKLLSGFVASLPNEKIILEERQQSLVVECASIKTEIRGRNSQDFPLPPILEGVQIWEIDGKKLCQALSQVMDIASPSQTRPEISGIYCVVESKALKVVATDSFRLGEKKIALEKEVESRAFILPQKPARELVSLWADRDGMITVRAAGNQVQFEFPIKEAEHPQAELSSRLIEGEYPNYQDIIPQKHKTRVIAKREVFLNQIKTASLFSGKINEVKIVVNPQTQEVAISAKSPELGETHSMFAAKVEGEPAEISFNYKFLIDGLDGIKSSEISFDISKEEGPCVMRPLGDGTYLYVVMPIKLM